MSKAEDLAKELFPLLETDKLGNNPYITYNTKQLVKREGYVEGYHQAEKDLELTVKDIKKIYHLVNEVSDDLGVRAMYVNIYQEALKRFKDFKERK